MKAGLQTALNGERISSNPKDARLTAWIIENGVRNPLQLRMA